MNPPKHWHRCLNCDRPYLHEADDCESPKERICGHCWEKFRLGALWTEKKETEK